MGRGGGQLPIAWATPGLPSQGSLNKGQKSEGSPKWFPPPKVVQQPPGFGAVGKGRKEERVRNAIIPVGFGGKCGLIQTCLGNPLSGNSSNLGRVGGFPQRKAVSLPLQSQTPTALFFAQRCALLLDEQRGAAWDGHPSRMESKIQVL